MSWEDGQTEEGRVIVEFNSEGSQGLDIFFNSRSRTKVRKDLKICRKSCCSAVIGTVAVVAVVVVVDSRLGSSYADLSNAEVGYFQSCCRCQNYQM